MRDWTRTLRRASYRGVSFWVESDDLSGGKRLAVHEHAGGKSGVIEELGLMTRAFDVTAYLVSDTADIQARIFLAAMEADGPGILTLPLDPGFMATVQNFRRSRTKNVNGYIGWDVTFLPNAAPSGAVLSIGDVSVAFSANIGPVSLELSAFF